MSTVAAFVNGIFDGMDRREAGQDRQRNRDRQATLDERAADRHEWAGQDRARAAEDRQRRLDWAIEDRNYTKSERARVAGERDRATKERNEDRDFFRSLPLDGHEAEAAAAPVPTPEAAPSAAPDPREMAGAETSPAPDRTGRAKRMIEVGSTVPEQGMSPRASSGRETAVPAPQSAPNRSAAPSGMTQPGRELPLYADEEGAPRTYEERAILLRAPTGLVELARDADEFTAVLNAHKTGEAPLNDTDVKLVEDEIQKITSFISQFEARSGDVPSNIPPEQVPAPQGLDDPARPISPRGMPSSRDRNAHVTDPAQRPQQPNAPAAESPTAPGAPQQPGPAPQDARTPATAQDRPAREVQTAMTTVEGTPKGSVEAVAETVPKVSARASGVPGAKPSAKQMKRASDSAIDRYYKVNAPAIIKHYLSKGEIEKATAFEAFIDRRETKTGLKSWAAAMHAAAVNDDEGFVENMIKTYNATGYYDDGYTVVADQSGLTRDGQGNAVGAKITFKNEESGEVFTQDFNTTEDLYSTGINLLSPEQIFEQMYGEVKQAKDLRRNLQLKMLEKGVNEGQQEEILDVAEQLGKINPSFISLPLEEQLAQARAYLSGGNGRAISGNPSPGDVPVFR